VSDRGPSLVTLIRLALTGGRADRLRIALTAVAAAVGAVMMLGAVTVIGIDAGFDRYRLAFFDQKGLHRGVLAAIAVMLVPLMAFVGQCSRIGAPARDRRLAALRMAGATSRDVRAVVSIETGAAAGLGAAVGAVVFATARSVVPNAPDVTGRRLLPTDVEIGAGVHVLIVVVLVIAAVLLARSALRRVSVDPLGVTRMTRQSAPAAFPLLLLIGGTLGLAFFSSVFVGLGFNEEGELAPIVVAFGLFVAVAAGLSFGSAALAQRLAIRISSSTASPAVLIAARRISVAPFRASRPTAAVLSAVLLGAGLQQTRTTFLLVTDPQDTFYRDTFDLLNGVLAVAIVFAALGLLIAAAEGLLERRRSFAALLAAGTPMKTLRRAVIVEALIPLVPGTAIALLAGTLAARGFFGTRVAPYVEGLGVQEDVLISVPVPWLVLGVLGAGAVITTVVVTAGGLLFVRSATDLSELRAAA